MSNFSDMAISRIRTVVPILVGAAFTWANHYANDHFGYGLPIDSAQVAVPATAAAVWLYWEIARRVEQHWPKLGKVLLGTGRQPTYSN